MQNNNPFVKLLNDKNINVVAVAIPIAVALLLGLPCKSNLIYCYCIILSAYLGMHALLLVHFLARCYGATHLYEYARIVVERVSHSQVASLAHIGGASS